MKLLTLDLAAVTGIGASRAGAEPALWSQRISHKEASDGRFCHDFELFCGDLIATEQPDAVVYEAPILWGGKTDVRTAARLMAMPMILKMVCYRRGVPRVYAANMSDVRMFFIGTTRFKGEDRADRRSKLKDAIISECQRRGWKVSNDNEADAGAIYAWAEHALGQRVAMVQAA